MKYPVLMATLSTVLFAHAYLVKGVRTTILVEGFNKSEVEAIYFEGCEKEDCLKPEFKSRCAEDGPSKFYCHLKDQYPSFVSFTVQFKGHQLLSTKFFPTNGESSLSNFKLKITKSAVRAEPIKDIL